MINTSETATDMTKNKYVTMDTMHDTHKVLQLGYQVNYKIWSLYNFHTNTNCQCNFFMVYEIKVKIIKKF
jgi:hypothetical protein